jgi:cysteine-rich repeat protein
MIPGLVVAAAIGLGCSNESHTVADDANGGSDAGGSDAGGSDAGGAGLGGTGGESAGTGGAGGESAGTGGAGGNAAVVGDCLVEGAEECDDCNAEPGDGCDDQGAIEPGWDCPTEGAACQHVSGFAEQNPTLAGMFGGNGGSAFARACPAGTALVGLSAEDASNCACASPAGSLGSVVLHCAPVTVSAIGALGWQTPVSLLARAGGTQGVGAALGDLVCAQDEFVVGVHGAIGSAYGEVSAVALDCAPLTFETSAMGGSIAKGTVTTTATLGSGSLTESVACPGDQIVSSVDGNAGAVVDRLAISCSLPAPTFCGDAVIDAHESCDDDNSTAGDGCDTTCRIEAGFACPTPGGTCLHVSGFVEQGEALVGGMGSFGGTPFDQVCPAGSALVGFTAENAQSCACGAGAGELGSLVPQCAPVTVAAGGHLGWSLPTSQLARVGGGQGVGAALGDLLCAQNEFVVGLRGRIGGAYGQVQGLAIDCAPFHYESGLGGGAIVPGPTVTSGVLGLGPSTQALLCPFGALTSRLGGRSGALVDRLEPHCAIPVPTFCGDSVIDPHETCDDGNIVPGDGCDATCRIE